jgi:hypothetical protein
MTDRTWSQLDIENEIIRLEGILEDTTDEFAKVCQQAANAEATFRVSYAKSFVRYRLGVEKSSEKTAEAQATAECERELFDRRGLESQQRGLEEKCRSLRASLDAVRTLSANVRAQT